MNEKSTLKRTRFYPFLILFILLIILPLIIIHTVNAMGDSIKATKRRDGEYITVKGQYKTDLSLLGGGEDWMLTLVNKENPLSDNYSPKLERLQNGLEFDARAIDQLNLMLSDAKELGLSPVVCSAYRSIEYQQKLFDNQVNSQMSRGLSREQAEIETSKAISYPGTSEHNLGLAVDIVSIDYQILDERQAETAEIKWLIEHCKEYGFILRYPKDKIDITGVIYEPWHFRYVGIEAAKEIMNDGITLEEYLLGK